MCPQGLLSGQPSRGQRENKGRVWWGAARGDPQVLGTRLICRALLPLSPSRGRHQHDLPVPAPQRLRAFQGVCGDQDMKEPVLLDNLVRATT